jgi:hypothetical protein
MTKDERKYFDKIARLGCSLCRYLELGETPSHIHHIRRLGGKRELSEVIPLCPEHHTGNTGIHGLGRKGFFKLYGIDEDFLLEQTKGLIYLA